MHKPPCREYHSPSYDLLTSKKEQRMALISVEKANTQVASTAKHLPSLPGTTIKKSFIKYRVSSWQLHLQRISPFLTGGEGMWWNFTENGFHFLDGDDDPSTHGEPVLLHFRQQSIIDVHARREECWDKLIRDHVLLPADTVKLYDPDGKLMARLLYKDNEVTYIIPNM